MVDAKPQSRHTYRELHLLSQSSPQSALRVVALIDYDAFYAQCESVRLGLPETTPLAVQQWNAIIALNYPARRYGLRQGISVDEAKQGCPELVLQHVPTWREGDISWAYRSDVLQNMRTDKSALDPYRLASRKSLELIKTRLPPAPVQRIERASVDEVFLDLSRQVYETLVKRYPELLVAPPQSTDDYLPLPDVDGLDWRASFVFGDEGRSPYSTPAAIAWGNVTLSIGSEIVHDLRGKIFQRLRYTCSAGVACNKSLAKLAASYRKPNQQTVILNGAIAQFLSSLKFTKIRGLGRDLGQQMAHTFQTDQVSELLLVPLATIQSTVGLESGL